MAPANIRKFYLFFSFTTVVLLLQGCAVYPVAAVLAPELIAPNATAMRVTGSELRQGADFSYSYPKHLDMTVMLDHADWMCYRGKGSYAGQELCLLPREAKSFGKHTWFECHVGRGGSITLMATGDRSYYCIKEQQARS